MHFSSLRQPGHPEYQDPWFCVTRLLWFCPFGDLAKICFNFSDCPAIKKHPPSAEDECSCKTCSCRAQDAFLISSATRPSCKIRIRGFASPDYSGFALSEIFGRLTTLNQFNDIFTRPEFPSQGDFLPIPSFSVLGRFCIFAETL